MRTKLCILAFVLIANLVCFVFPVSASSLGTLYGEVSTSQQEVLSKMGSLIKREGDKQYDYAPSVIQEGSVQKIWWCGFGQDGADNIFYQEIDVPRQTGTPIRSVLSKLPGSSWQSQHVCDPAVVTGDFRPYSHGPYRYAMFYTATAGGDGGNAIGVVFSKDGIKWDGQEASYNPFPLLDGRAAPKTERCKKNKGYGIGQPGVWNRNGKASLQLFWTDTCQVEGKDGFYTTTLSIDEAGFHFGSPVLLSQSGAVPRWNNDIAVDSSKDILYLAAPQSDFFDDCSGPRDPRLDCKGEMVSFQVLTMDVNTALSGGGTWNREFGVTPELTGFKRNYSPTFLRNGYGELTYTKKASGIEVFFAVDNGDVYYNSDIRWFSHPDPYP